MVRIHSKVWKFLMHPLDLVLGPTLQHWNRSSDDSLAQLLHKAHCMCINSLFCNMNTCPIIIKINVA
jgi:hypothetical protein